MHMLSFKAFISAYALTNKRLVHCNALDTISACAVDEFSCSSGECIDLGCVCDGVIQCTDGSDEDDCPIPGI